MNPKRTRRPGPGAVTIPIPSNKNKAMQPTALEALADAELDLTQAEQRLEDARRVVMNEFKEELVRLYNAYGLRVACSVDFEVTVETLSGTATVENQFGPR